MTAPGNCPRRCLQIPERRGARHPGIDIVLIHYSCRKSAEAQPNAAPFLFEKRYQERGQCLTPSLPGGECHKIGAWRGHHSGGLHGQTSAAKAYFLLAYCGTTKVVPFPVRNNSKSVLFLGI